MPPACWPSVSSATLEARLARRELGAEAAERGTDAARRHLAVRQAFGGAQKHQVPEGEGPSVRLAVRREEAPGDEGAHPCFADAQQCRGVRNRVGALSGRVSHRGEKVPAGADSRPPRWVTGTVRSGVGWSPKSPLGSALAGGAGRGPVVSASLVLRRVTATRYVTPLREGGSLPAIVEADDAGLYVLKFRGAGQGPKALVAEVLAGELARALGFRVPELVLAELEPELGRAEPDSEIRALLKASAGLNLGVDYLPGSITFDPVAGPAPTEEEASELVCFDGLRPECRPHGEKPKPSLLAPRPLAHRPRGGAVFSPRVEGRPEERHQRLFRPLESTCFCPGPRAWCGRSEVAPPADEGSPGGHRPAPSRRVADSGAGLRAPRGAACGVPRLAQGAPRNVRDIRPGGGTCPCPAPLTMPSSALSRAWTERNSSTRASSSTASPRASSAPKSRSTRSASWPWPRKWTWDWCARHLEALPRICAGGSRGRAHWPASPEGALALARVPAQHHASDVARPLGAV